MFGYVIYLLKNAHYILLKKMGDGKQTLHKLAVFIHYLEKLTKIISKYMTYFYKLF